METSIESAAGDLRVRLGRRFDAPDAERVADAVLAFAPFSRLTVDFTNVREFSDAAVIPLARTLAGLDRVHVLLRGMTRHQYRLLRYLGLEVGFAPTSEGYEDPPLGSRRSLATRS